MIPFVTDPLRSSCAPGNALRVSDSISFPAPSMGTWEEIILHFLARGSFSDAAALYQEEHGVGSLEAEQRVAEIARRHGLGRRLPFSWETSAALWLAGFLLGGSFLIGALAVFLPR